MKVQYNTMPIKCTSPVPHMWRTAVLRHHTCPAVVSLPS